MNEYEGNKKSAKVEIVGSVLGAIASMHRRR